MAAFDLRPETSIDQIEILELLCKDEKVKETLDILSEPSSFTKGGRINKTVLGRKIKLNQLQTDVWLNYVRDLTMFFCGSLQIKPSYPPPPRKKYKRKTK